MSTVRTPVRLVIHGGLLLCLTATSLQPCIAKAAERKASWSSVHAGQPSMLAGADGRRSNRASLPGRDSKKDQAPCSSMPADDQDETRSLDSAVITGVVVSSDTISGPRFVLHPLETSCNSLVAMSVRFNN